MQVGDVVVITQVPDPDLHIWVGFKGKIIGLHTKTGNPYLRPLSARPDSGDLSPFYWPEADLALDCEHRGTITLGRKNGDMKCTNCGMIGRVVIKWTKE